jgi:hypothetical protein
MEENESKVLQMEPEKLGKIMIEIDCDTNKYQIGFTNVETGRMLNQVEQVNMFSPFHAACIINELKRRMEGKAIKPVTNLIIH